MLEDLPKSCDIGMKKNAKGLVGKWIGYKLHIDTADGGIPIGCVLTSASTHDSQVAIPLGTLTAGRVENLYDLMDSAYDSIEIWAHSISLGHKPIIAVNPRGSVDMKEALKLEKRARRTLGLFFPEEDRYAERSTAERLKWAVQGLIRRPPCPRARLQEGAYSRHVWHYRAGGQSTYALHGSADLIQLASFAVTIAAPLERRAGQVRPQFDEETAWAADSAQVRPQSATK